jgi:hypothetical protein
MDNAKPAPAPQAEKSVIDANRAARAELAGRPDEATRAKAAKAAGCKPDEVIGYREYADKHVVVVHGDVSVSKVEVAKK